MVDITHSISGLRHLPRTWEIKGEKGDACPGDDRNAERRRPRGQEPATKCPARCCQRRVVVRIIGMTTRSSASAPPKSTYGGAAQRSCCSGGRFLRANG